MTRKDYVLLSSAFNRALIFTDPDRPDCREGIKHAAYIVALSLFADNRRFDTNRFLTDCTGEAE